MPVYTVRPTGTATSFATRYCRTLSASRPLTMNLENDDMSNSATASRHARCSAALHACQFCLPYEYSIAADCRPGEGRDPSAADCRPGEGRDPLLSGTKKFGRSQPIFEPNDAPFAVRCA